MFSASVTDLRRSSPVASLRSADAVGFSRFPGVLTIKYLIRSQFPPRRLAGGGGNETGLMSSTILTKSNPLPMDGGRVRLADVPYPLTPSGSDAVSGKLDRRSQGWDEPPPWMARGNPDHPKRYALWMAFVAWCRDSRVLSPDASSTARLRCLLACRSPLPCPLLPAPAVGETSLCPVGGGGRGRREELITDYLSTSMHIASKGPVKPYPKVSPTPCPFHQLMGRPPLACSSV